MLQERCHAKSSATKAPWSSPLAMLQAEKTTTTVSQMRIPRPAPTSFDHGRNLLPTARSSVLPPRMRATTSTARSGAATCASASVTPRRAAG